MAPPSNRLLPALLLSVLPFAAACSQKLTGPSPTVTTDTLTFCGSDQQQFVIHGTNISPVVKNGAKDNAAVDLPDVCLVQTAVDGDAGASPDKTEHCVPEADVSWISKTEIRFNVRGEWAKSVGLTSGWYDVIVRNPDGKEAGNRVRLHVLEDGPLVFWADPGVVYNGISTQITVYGANLEQIDSTQIRDSQTLASTNVTFSQDTGKLNRVSMIIPKNAGDGGAPLAPTTYDIVVHSANGCQAELIRGLRVTDTVDLVVTSIDPTFGSKNESTPVTIVGAGFQQVPRAYLNPKNPTATTVASALGSVAFASDTNINGVVPPGLDLGVYDLFVVNPDGHVGLLSDAFTVTELPPPVVANISPNFVPSQTASQTLTFEGSDFRSPAVTFSCKDPTGGTPSPTGVSVSTTGTATSFDVTLVTASLPQGTVCVARVTNSDGSYYDYSAIGLTNSALNFNQFKAGPSMSVARRAPAVAAGRATRAARFLYVMGGDDGTPAGAMNTVETAPINVYGEPSAFFTQPVNLPGPRTLASVIASGRFLYLVGGNDGTAATGSVVRAQVLDPLAAPQIVDVSARRAKVNADAGATEGIGAGVWYYRVAAVMADTDPSNPGGETLPSDPLAVNLPTEFQGTLVLTLFWNPVPGAKAYRVYRSPTGMEPVGGVQLLADVPGGTTTSYTDIALSGGTTAGSPRPLGATGVWMPLPSLATARQALGLGIGQDPAAASTWYLYALGGSSGTADLASTEMLAITANADGTQSFAASWAAAAALPLARSELTGYSMTHATAPALAAGTTYIYAGGGKGSDAVDRSLVTAGGALTWVNTNNINPSHSGYAGIGGAGYLIALGGAQSLPDDGVPASVINAATGTASNWNANGTYKLTMPRYLAGSALESANMFIVGGVTTGNTATASIERSVL